MIILANVMSAIAVLLSGMLLLLKISVLASVVISWLNADPYNPIVRAIREFTEPIYRLVRSRVPLVFGSIDLTPVLLLFALQFIDMVLVKSLSDYASQLILQSLGRP
jgi:YggT family protein